jgi:hypothetical protein
MVISEGHHDNETSKYYIFAISDTSICLFLILATLCTSCYVSLITMKKIQMCACVCVCVHVCVCYCVSVCVCVLHRDFLIF